MVAIIASRFPPSKCLCIGYLHSLVLGLPASEPCSQPSGFLPGAADRFSRSDNFLFRNRVGDTHLPTRRLHHGTRRTGQLFVVPLRTRALRGRAFVPNAEPNAAQ